MSAVGMRHRSRTRKLVRELGPRLQVGDLWCASDGNRWRVNGPPVPLAGTRDVVVRVGLTAEDPGFTVRLSRWERVEVLRVVRR